MSTAIPPSGADAAPPDNSDLDRRSLGELFGEVTKDLSTLMRQEVALAKAEVTESAKRAGKGAGMLSGAALAGYLTLLFLSMALWWALADLFDSIPWGAVVVAVIWGIVAAVLAVTGRSELKKAPGVPQTADTVKKIPNALKGDEEENR